MFKYCVVLHQCSIFTFNLVLLLSEGQAGEAGKLRTDQCCSGCRGSLDRETVPHCEVWSFYRVEVEDSVLLGCYGEGHFIDSLRFERTYRLNFQRFLRNEVMLILSMANNKSCIPNFYNFLRLPRFVNYTCRQYVYKPTRCTKFLWLDFIFH